MRLPAPKVNQPQQEYDLIWCALTERKWELERRLRRLRSVLSITGGLIIGMSLATTTLWLGHKTRVATVETIIIVLIGIVWVYAFRVYRWTRRVTRDIEKLLS